MDRDTGLPSLPAKDSNGTPSSLKRFSLSSNSSSRDFNALAGPPTPPTSSLNGSARMSGPRPLRLSTSTTPNLKDIATRTASPTSSIASSIASSSTATETITSPNRPSPSPSIGRMRAGHARKGSSISYSSSSNDISSLSSLPSSRARTDSNTSLLSRARTDSSSSLGSPTTDRFQVSSSSRNSLKGLEEENENLERDSSTGDGFLGSNRNIGASMGAAPTLSELHADLLSFIAKKERLCMDLREELKRHDADLTILKKKWESIVVAKALASAPVNSSRSSLESKRPYVRYSLSSAPYISPEITNKPLPPDSPDLSRHSSSFDPLVDYDAVSAAEIELGESVQAAKKWVGGVFSNILGIPEAERDRDYGDVSKVVLGALTEEEEEEPEETHKRGESLASASSVEDRRISRASTSSSISAAHSSLGFGAEATVAPLEASNSGSSIFNLYASEEEAAGAREVRTFSEKFPVRKVEGGHARRRSTFDMLSSASVGGFTSLSKRWTGLTESETFKNSKRTALDTLNTLEQAITESLGPLDPPSRPYQSTTPTFSPPLGAYRDLDAPPMIPGLLSSSISAGLSSWSQNAPLSASKSRKTQEDLDKTPRPTDDAFDWSTFLGSETIPSEEGKVNGTKKSLDLISPIVPTKATSPIVTKSAEDEWGAWE